MGVNRLNLEILWVAKESAIDTRTKNLLELKDTKMAVNDVIRAGFSLNGMDCIVHAVIFN